MNFYRVYTKNCTGISYGTNPQTDKVWFCPESGVIVHDQFGKEGKLIMRRSYHLAHMPGDGSFEVYFFEGVPEMKTDLELFNLHSEKVIPLKKKEKNEVQK